MQYRLGLLVAAGVIAVGLQAEAQDRWAGLYAGLSLDRSKSDVAVGSNATHRYASGDTSIGGYVGYNFVREGGFVWGPEIGLTGISSNGTRSDATLGDSGVEGSFLLTPRLRAGWATDSFFFYGSAGFGMSDLSAKPTSSLGTDVTMGLSYGVGVEMAISDRWSGRLVANIHDFGEPTRSFNGVSQGVKSELRVISLGLTRKF